MTALKNLLSDDNGATLVEYGLIVALIAVVCIAVVSLLGKNVNSNFSTIASDV